MIHFWCSAILWAALPSLDVATKDQRLATGELVELSAERVVLKQGNQTQTIPTADVVEIRPHDPRDAAVKPGPIQVRLVDGSQLEASEYRVEKGKAAVVLDPDTRASVSTRVIDYVRLQTSGGALGQQWNDIVKAERTGDVIVVRKEETLDFVAGVSGDVTDEFVHFDVDGDKVPVKRPKVEGVLYFHAAGDELPVSFCSLQPLGGGKIEVLSAKAGDAALDVATPAGVSLSIPWNRLGRIQFKVAYLSDLAPETVAYSREQLLGFREQLKPHDLAFHRPRFNEGFETGQPLRVGGQTYSKGISLYSGAEVSFRLTDRYRELQTTVGIDDSVRPHGQVELKLLDDDRVLSTHSISGRDQPLVLVTPLEGVRRLRITVRSRAGGDHDRVFLCDPRLVK